MPQPVPTSAQTCPTCSSLIDPQRALGLCPICLLENVAEQLTGQHGPQSCPTINQLNQQIQGFQFIELLGRGGAAWTFLAMQESLSREVAVKVMHRNGNWGDSRARFQREAESLAKLNHPGIVTIHDFGSTEDYHYLIMEFVAGPTLRRRLNTIKPSVRQSLSIAGQICEAVQYAHDAGILHRDIKPENILYSSDSTDAQTKVADFGIAQIFANEELESLTRTGLVSGTPYYIAPEQNLGLNQASPRSDVFAIGVVLYELLTGQLPIGNFPPPSHYCGCSREVDKAVLNALQSRPEKRTKDPKTFASQLEQRPSKFLWTMAAVVTLVALPFILWLVLGYLPDSKPAIEQTPVVEPTSPATTADTPADIPINKPADKTSNTPINHEEENPFLKNWTAEELE